MKISTKPLHKPIVTTRP